MIKRVFVTISVLMLPIAAFATEYQTVERPRQECWNEQVPVQSARTTDYGGALVGGLAGGLLGSQVGGGRGRTVATAVGAMTGAIVGDRMSGNSAQQGYQSAQTVRRCRTVMAQVRVPVYYEPAPAAYAPVPVVTQSVYYVDQPEPMYREQWQRDRWQRERLQRERWQREQWQREHWRNKSREHDDEDRGRRWGRHGDGHHDDDDED
jgi:uncharacterized protein YcfJ